MRSEGGYSVGFWKTVLAVAAGMLAATLLSGGGGVGIGIILPFVIAYIAARILRPAGVFLSRACRVNEKVGCTVYACLICIGVIYAVIGLSSRLISELWALTEKLPSFAADVSEMFSDLYELLPLPGEGETEKIISHAFSEAASYIGGEIGGFLTSFVGNVPGGVWAVFMTIAAFVYLMADMEGAGKSLCAVLPKKYSERASRMFRDASGAVFSYIRAYFIIMTVTFFELLVGLSAVGVSGTLTAALVITIIDVLPVLGCGTVLVPWALRNFVKGEIRAGVGLLVVFGVIYVVRQFLEPRLIGRMTGVHPFVVLLGMYVGLKTCGIGGMIGVPIALMCVMAGKEKEKV